LINYLKFFLFITFLLSFSCTQSAKKIQDADTSVEDESACNYGDKRCTDDKKGIMVCTDKEQWVSVKTCPQGSSCEDGMCYCSGCAIPVQDTCHPVSVKQCPKTWKKTDGCGCEPVVDSCADNEVPVMGGGCQKIGPVCGEGFNEISGGGCEPVLDECGENERPLIGGGCKDYNALNDCGEGTWGNIQWQAGYVYVNPNYEGTDSNGSQQTPFRKIDDALIIVPDGGTVILAEGIYGDVPSLNRSVNIKGVCASKVIISSGLEFPYAIGNESLKITTGLLVDKTEKISIEGVTFLFSLWIQGSKNITVKNCVLDLSPVFGIISLNTENFKVQQSLIKNITDSGTGFGNGITVFGGSSISIDGNIIENISGNGVFIQNAPASVRENLIRNIQKNSKTGESRGIYVTKSTKATIEKNIIQNGSGTNIDLRDSKVTVAKNILINTLNHKGIYCMKTELNDASVEMKENYIDGSDSAGVEAHDIPSLTLTNNTFRNNKSSGILLMKTKCTADSNAIIETAENSESKKEGRSLSCEDSDVTVTKNIVSGTQGSGMIITNSSGVVKDNKLKNFTASSYGTGGGIRIISSGKQDKEFAVTHNYIKNALGSGFNAEKSHVIFDGNFIEDTAATKDDTHGSGTGVLSHGCPHIAIKENSIVKSRNAGIFAYSDDDESNVEISGNYFYDTLAETYFYDPSEGTIGEKGFGIALGQKVKFVIENSAIVKSNSAGIAIFGSYGEIRNSLVSDTGEGGFINEGGDFIKTADGISVSNSASIVISDSVITDNQRAGIIIFESAAKIDLNLISGSETGISYDDKSSVEMGTNQIDSSVKTPVAADGKLQSADDL
jgi:hypothetical protein